nr:hypothetical protein CFP56_67627 [Quercus suber]
MSSSTDWGLQSPGDHPLCTSTRRIPQGRIHRFASCDLLCPRTSTEIAALHAVSCIMQRKKAPAKEPGFGPSQSYVPKKAGCHLDNHFVCVLAILSWYIGQVLQVALYAAKRAANSSLVLALNHHIHVCDQGGISHACQGCRNVALLVSLSAMSRRPISRSNHHILATKFGAVYRRYHSLETNMPAGPFLGRWCRLYAVTPARSHVLMAAMRWCSI